MEPDQNNPNQNQGYPQPSAPTPDQSGGWDNVQNYQPVQPQQQVGDNQLPPSVYQQPQNSQINPQSYQRQYYQANNVPPQVNQPQQNNQAIERNPYSIDYLNEIAPKEQKPFFDRKMKILTGFLGAVMLFGAIMLMAFGGNDETGAQAVLKLYLRTQTTVTLSKKYQDKLINTKLRAINSGIYTSLASDEAALLGRLTTLSVKIPTKSDKKNPSKVYEDTQKEFADLDVVLDDAMLNVKLDRTYVREISYRLEIIKSSIKTIKSKDKSKDTASILDKMESDLEVSIKQLEDYSKTDN